MGVLANKFFITINSSKIEISKPDLKSHGYFLGGYRNKDEAGKLYYRIIEGLVPVFDENNKPIISDQYFGKEVSQTAFLD